MSENALKNVGENTPITIDTIREYLCPKATDQELVMFKDMCITNKLNPFCGDAYLVKFGTSPAQMITSEAAFNKKINSIENLDGIRDGLIVEDKEGVHYVEGEFYSNSQKLVGAWAEVHIKGKSVPTKVSIRLEDYDKNQSSWKTMKARMINKCARVQAIRKCCPEAQGLYIKEEQGVMSYADSSQPKETTPRFLKTEKNVVQIDYNENLETISPDQVNTIKEVFDELKGKKLIALDRWKTIKDMFGVEDVENLPADAYEDFLSELQK